LFKSEIIDNLKKKHPNLSNPQVEIVVDTIFETISRNLSEDTSVELRNFGRWSVKNIKAKYNARNPKTGENIYVPEKKKIAFKMSKNLKEVLNRE
tara:strand:- start:1555 stop:1839 length:285 start_codon:yes stop_codon:yes gene_type:complete